MADGPDKFAIEGWIDSDGYPTVIVTRVLRPGADPVNVSDAMVRWARVTISDGTRTVTLTGGIDHSVIPPFSYTNYNMQGVVGRTYTIEAEYDGIKASATSTMLSPAEITHIDVTHVSDSIYSATLTYSAPDDGNDCCLVAYTRVRGVDSRPYPSYMGAVRVPAGTRTGQMPLCRGKHVDLADTFSPDFVYGDTVDVILTRVEPAVYDFWTAYQNEVYLGNNIFISANDTPTSNINGGYGVFAARGISRTRLIVR